MRDEADDTPSLPDMATQLAQRLVCVPIRELSSFQRMLFTGFSGVET